MVDFDYLNQISHTTSMLDVLDYYDIEYHNAGTDRYKVICPFHDDHTPSLVVYTTDNNKDESFCCYVDNTAGDPFHFIREMEGDFKQSWVVLCHINNIDDPESDGIDKLDSLLRPNNSREDKRSISSINYQISTMYRDLHKRLSSKLSQEDRKKLLGFIDKRYLALDEYLGSKPSYADTHQYFKHELDRLKQLQASFK